MNIPEKPLARIYMESLAEDCFFAYKNTDTMNKAFGLLEKKYGDVNTDIIKAMWFAMNYYSWKTEGGEETGKKLNSN